jgi:molecular chaperone DnaK
MQSAVVAKLYVRTPDDELGRKLEAMVRLGTKALTEFAAWPQDLVFDSETGSIVGFLMRKVEGHRGIHELYGPTTRKQLFPEATWAFLLRAARNVAVAFETVHGHGHVIGDVNEGNIVVSNQATVQLIDCDSFQITHLGRSFHCRVGVPLYTPPELQGRRLGDVLRTPDHDCFGLAVLLFQLLFMGRHPFAGRHPERGLSMATAIREGLFAFGEEAARQGWEPPPSSLTLADIPPSVGQLFERAFGQAAHAGTPRPSATEWVHALEAAEVEIAICSKEPRHAYAGVNHSCPWCRIESERGPSFFVPQPTVQPRTVDVWSRVGGKMIGIDLGTTNSCVAVMEGGVPQVIPNQEGARTTPSIVGFTAKGERLVGQIAKRQALTNPKNTVFAVKRLIGRRFESPQAQEARRRMPFQLVEAPNGDAHLQIEDKVYSPPEISSFVLQKLKAAAEDYLGEAVEEAIITVPSTFDDTQRQATKDAGLIAGLKVSRIINEPTAAALAYGLKNSRRRSQFVAVYDLGGGTFNITILEIADGLFQVRATGGDSYLGGEDFDQRIIDWLIGEFSRETGIDLKQDRMALQRVKEAAEKAKCELSTAQQTEIVLPFISADASGPKHLNTVLTRQKFEELTDELLQRTIQSCEGCLWDAQMKPEQIDEVLLVGGQTRSPKVTEVVRQVFGKEPNRAVNPDEGVAMGAAILAGIIQGEVKDLVLLDVTPYTLGMETQDGTLTPLIERNSTIPTRKSRVFTTVADNQTRVEVHVLQGESDMAAYNKSLAKFELTNIPPAPKGVPQIEIGFEIDVNGIVSVEATDQATGRRQQMTVHPSGGLSQSDVNRLAAERRAEESEDKSKKEQVVRQLEGLVTNTMRSVQALEGKLTPDEVQRILDSIERAKKARGSSSSHLIPGVKKSKPRDDSWALGALHLQVRRAFAERGSRLTAQERQWVQGALDSVKRLTGGDEELMRCREALERALRLLESVRRLH